MYLHIDIELLIVEVQNRPLLWDSSHPRFNDRIHKKESWRELCHALVDGYAEKSFEEREYILIHVMGRWKSVRDNFVRSIKKNCLKPRYVHMHLLEFLKKGLGYENSITSCDDTSRVKTEYDDTKTLPADDINTEDAGPSTHTIHQQSSSRKRKRTTTLEDKFIEYMESNKHMEDDEDSAFFKSLLPSVRTLDFEQKFQFRMHVMHALQIVKTKLPDIVQPGPQFKFIYKYPPMVPPTTNYPFYMQPTFPLHPSFAHSLLQQYQNIPFNLNAFRQTSSPQSDSNDSDDSGEDSKFDNDDNRFNLEDFRFNDTNKGFHMSDSGIAPSESSPRREES